MASVSKLHGDYYAAEHALIVERNKRFPVGATVTCPLNGWQCRVKAGSLYAHQINTDKGHMGWQHLITEPIQAEGEK